MAGDEYEVECPHCGAVFAMAGAGATSVTCPVCKGAVAVDAAGAGPHDGPAVRELAQAPGEQGPVPLDAAGIGREAPAYVCMTREEKASPITLGALFERYTGLGRLEARRYVVRSHGLLLEDVAFATAETAVAALREENCDAFAVPAEAVPDVRRELSIVRIYGADERALRIQTDRHGSIRSVRWTTVAAAMCTLRELERRTVTERIPESTGDYIGVSGIGGLYAGPSHRTRRRQVEPVLRVTLVLRDKVGHAYLLSFTEDQVRYGYLGERIQMSREQNLELLLEDVARWAPHAFYPAGYRAAAGGVRPRVTKLMGTPDEERYLRWTLCCAAARGLFRPRT